MLNSGPVQTSYHQYSTVAQVGMPGDGTNYNVTTGILEDPSGAGVPWGLAVSRGTLHGDKSVVKGSLSGGTFVGILLRAGYQQNYGGTFADKFIDGDNVPYVDWGPIWVSPATTNVVTGHQVYFNSVTGELGDSSISNATAIPNSQWLNDKPNTDRPQLNFNGLAQVLLGTRA